MQLLTWPISRLGSRFSLMFEPHQRQVWHGALGRFLDVPMELSAGLVGENGEERAFPLCKSIEPLFGCEQFVRVNSITFRGFDEKTGLKLELNIHSPFYPQDEKLCLLPVFYVEMRVSQMKKIRWHYTRPMGHDKQPAVKLFFRLKRPETRIAADHGQIDLHYSILKAPVYVDHPTPPPPETKRVDAKERIISINDGAQPSRGDDGSIGLTLDLPITDEGSGVKWRMVWASHVKDAVLDIRGEPGQMAYNRYWHNLDEVVEAALKTRDDNLAHSRRFEKLLEQAPISRPAWHMLTYSFQNWLMNTWWCHYGEAGDWFSTWEGNCLNHSTVDVEFNTSPIMLAIWPGLLGKLISQLPAASQDHLASGGAILQHDLGHHLKIGPSTFHHPMPIEENSNALLLLLTYTRWTGQKKLLAELTDYVKKLANYLLWADRDGDGFPNEGIANTVDDASPAMQYARKQTYLAVKRVAAMQAAADLMQMQGEAEPAGRYREAARKAAAAIENQAWLGDHYAVCADPESMGLRDVWTDEPLPPGKLSGWDDYSIFTTSGLLPALMTGQSVPFDLERLKLDIRGALRETLTPYGCVHTSSDLYNIWISQNLWRDLTAQYLEVDMPDLAGRYWDLQTYANTAGQSYGYCDTYIGNELTFYPRGVASWGIFMAGPRLTLDRSRPQAPAAVKPDRHRPQRWPLLPLADWKAGRIPVCTVDEQGRVRIEGEIEPVEIKGETRGTDEVVIG